MILLTLIASKQKTLVNLSTMLYTAPNKLGTEIVYEKGRVAVVETSEEIHRLWHDSCTNSTSTNSTIIQPVKNTTHTNTTTSTSKNSGGAVGKGQVLLVNNMPIPVDGSTAQSLYDYCKANEPLLNLLGYWMNLYEQQGGQLTMVSAIDLGTLSRVVSTGAIEQAMAVFDWLFTSDHYRAVYLRSKGMVNPAVVVSTKKLSANYALSQQKPLPALPKSVQRPSTTINPHDFDDNGNFIVGGKNG
tara:strand:+ start:1638 stop:2369 length:732 start_codon:yes stop_codon:yes gene_type:complete